MSGGTGNNLRDRKMDIISGTIPDMLENGNCILGSKPILNNSTVKFAGRNNILFCEESVILNNGSLQFNGDNSVIYLGRSKYKYKLSVSIYNNSVFHMGRDNYINDKLKVILSEQKHVFIGSGNLFSFGIWVRNADPHLIYDAGTKERMNYAKSIYVGTHVWIGQSAMLLKGAQIASGSIIGAMGVVAGKYIPSNTIWVGNPVKMIKENIFWEYPCTHEWTDEQIISGRVSETDKYMFADDSGKVFQKIEDDLAVLKWSSDRVKYLAGLHESKETALLFEKS